jgi:hypothetical protein
MPPLTARGFADVWRGSATGTAVITNDDLDEALRQIRALRNYGYYTNPRTNAQEKILKHFNFEYGTTKHKRREL